MDKILILLFLFIGCGIIPIEKELVKYNNSYIEKEFIPSVQVFERNCNKKVDIDIRFSKIYFAFSTPIGICIAPHFPAFIKRTIYVDIEWWNEWGNYASLGEELILHELGHCVLDRMHNENMINYVDKMHRPKSIMYPTIFGYWGWYSQNREEYIKELCEWDQ